MSTSTRLPSPAIWNARQAPWIVTVLLLPARLASSPRQSPAKLEPLPAKLTAGSAPQAADPALPTAPATTAAAIDTFATIAPPDVAVPGRCGGAAAAASITCCVCDRRTAG